MATARKRKKVNKRKGKYTHEQINTKLDTYAISLREFYLSLRRAGFHLQLLEVVQVVQVVNDARHEWQATELAGTLGLVDVDDGVGRYRPDFGELALIRFLPNKVGKSAACFGIKPDSIEDVRRLLLAGRCRHLLRLNELQTGATRVSLGQKQEGFAIVEPATGG